MALSLSKPHPQSTCQNHREFFSVYAIEAQSSHSTDDREYKVEYYVPTYSVQKTDHKIQKSQKSKLCDLDLSHWHWHFDSTVGSWNLWLRRWHWSRGVSHGFLHRGLWVRFLGTPILSQIVIIISYNPFAEALPADRTRAVAVVWSDRGIPRQSFCERVVGTYS